MARMEQAEVSRTGALQQAWLKNTEQMCQTHLDVLTRLPQMTNHQIPEVTPAAWAKARQPLPQPRIINVAAYGCDIYDRNGWPT
jgi:hypothetical protein